MGRGSAVMVRFDSATRGRIEMREAQSADPNSCQSLPATSCANTQWDAASTQNRLIATFDPTDLNVYANVLLKFFKSDGADAGNAVDICFTPAGRPYRRLAHSGNFTVMNEVPYIEVSPVDGEGRTRTVLIVPTGASRLTL